MSRQIIRTHYSGVWGQTGMSILAYFIFNGIGYYDDKSDEQEKRYIMETI
jgi:hypothetical protein